MSRSDGLLLESEHGWRVSFGDQSETLDSRLEPTELAERIVTVAQRAGMKNPRLLVAPSATSCFFATFSMADRHDLRDRSALSYELENHLPLDAESMVADFMPVPSPEPGDAKAPEPGDAKAPEPGDAKAPEPGDAKAPEPGDAKVAAIALDVGRWKPLIDAIEGSGLTVSSLVPHAVLVAQAIRADPNISTAAGSAWELVLVDDQSCDALTFRGDALCQWKHFPFDRPSIKRHRRLEGGDSDQRFVAGADPEQQSMLREFDPDMRLIDPGLNELAHRGAELHAGSRAPRGFDLRRERLAPQDRFRGINKQLRVVGACLAGFLMVLAISGWWRSRRMEQQIERIQAQQQRLFREAFPASRLPAALVRRVRSEHTKILGSRGETSDVDIPTPATDVLRRLIAALPVDVRVRIKAIDVVDGRVDLDVQVRSPVDAGTIAKSLASAGFQVDPPGTTQKDSRTFESVIEAEWLGDPVDSTGRPSQASVQLAIMLEKRG